tara:strand:+ start:407 stop:520 length:114 start_codon:yes stop_codon:yes gene_type:complete
MKKKREKKIVPTASIILFETVVTNILQLLDNFSIIIL